MCSCTNKTFLSVFEHIYDDFLCYSYLMFLCLDKKSKMMISSLLVTLF